MTKENFNNAIGSIVNNSNVSSPMLNAARAVREFGALVSPATLNAARAAREFGALVSPATLNAARAAREFGALVSPATLNAARAAREFGALVSPATLNAARAAREFGALVSPATLNAVKNLIRQTDLLNNLQLSESILQAISEIDINELELYWEGEEVRETIKQEISALEIAENQKKLLDRLNNWVKMLIGLPNDLLEKSPKAVTYVLLLLSIINLVIRPAVEDIIKEKVWHLSDYLEGKTEEPIRKQTKTFKTCVIKDDEVASEISYSDAVRSMEYVRITNRKTDVFRSAQRKSGKVDTIQSNKPVIILYKKKNWSLVMYQDSNKQEIEGWVFTKNLIK
ncbi:hypothetical protein [Priestia megaterium]